MNSFFRAIPLILLVLSGCARPKQYLIESVYRMDQQPSAPDYTRPNYWAALPDRKDAADLVPTHSSFTNQQARHP
ncbi:hypothetical protein BWI93_21340 [Siphonobacter sp. BAB-5385]|uniref:hypothetical protein n=1 Tax=Siphonobacter sp. BAB-5385 TaxID=1864822 RepID=UPI000B9E0B3D|nr:hypothetical protein [Siphonobacter sp. BAB-5385]OZI06349.1 hypothetical protein BWI93_21340 [Siphonobacter sp. BAB-5385]